MRSLEFFLCTAKDEVISSRNSLHRACYEISKESSKLHLKDNYAYHLLWDRRLLLSLSPSRQHYICRQRGRTPRSPKWSLQDLEHFHTPPWHFRQEAPPLLQNFRGLLTGTGSAQAPMHILFHHGLFARRQYSHKRRLLWLEAFRYPWQPS